jgi:hypothetical protein
MDDTKLGRTKTVVAAPVRRLVMNRDYDAVIWKVLFVRQPLSSDGHHRTTLPFPAASQYLQLQY